MSASSSASVASSAAGDDASRKRLFLASVSRKRADQDALLLQNRLSLLRTEWEKAARKTEEWENKATGILDSRDKNI